MMNSLYNGVSGIKTQNFGLDVTANNISNVNTVGFIGSTAEFKSVLYTKLNGAANGPVMSQIGLGATSMASSLNTFKQGSPELTDGDFDIAIIGDGYFGVATNSGDIYFTRNGDFAKDANGDLVNQAGFFVQGTMINLTPTTLTQSAQSKIPGSIYNQVYTLDTNQVIKLSTPESQGKISLPDMIYLPAVGTTRASFAGSLDPNSVSSATTMNLDPSTITSNFDPLTGLASANGKVTDTNGIFGYRAGDMVLVSTNDGVNSITGTAYIDANGEFDLTNFDISGLNLSNPITFSYQAQIYQAQPNTAKFGASVYSPNGNKNEVLLEFTQILPTSPNLNEWSVNAQLLDPNGNLISQSSGVVAFNGSGALLSNTLGSLNNDGVSLNIDLGTLYNGSPNSGFTGIVLSGQNAMSKVEVNGEEEGLLRRYALDDDGNILASFDNGKTVKVAKIALYHFQNDQGLEKLGSSLFAQSANSGKPIFWSDANGEVIYGAKLKSSALEMSNVDLSTELTNLIVMEKAYSASAKSITTSNEILQTIIDMKR